MFKLTKKQKDILRKEFGMTSCDTCDIVEHIDEIRGRVFQICGNLLENGEISEENYDLIGTILKLYNAIWSNKEFREGVLG